MFLFPLLVAMGLLGESRAEAYWRHNHDYHAAYYRGGHDHYSPGHRHHRWSRHGHRWGRSYRDFDYYRPSMYRDYFPRVVYFAPPGTTLVSHGLATNEKKPEKKVVPDEVCDTQMAALKENEEKIKKDGASVLLLGKSEELKDKVLNACVPSWAQRAAGIEKKEVVVNNQPAGGVVAASAL